ncbi:MAG: aminoglycoside phosphotransferase family protein [Propionibacteriales bacterium]|nr:aminoglycoside phosphotransferase family protein [Propionibacteriales bacterium]
MSTMRVPDAVWRAAGVDPYEVITRTPVTHGTGAASGSVELITGRRRDESTTIVAKTLRPLTTGRHAEASRQTDHWAYWRRELLAHRSGLLPSGPGLRAPRLWGIDEDTLFTEYVGDQPPDAETAALHLGRWLQASRTPTMPWMTSDQLGQRLAVTSLDWTGLDVEVEIRQLWDQRDAYLAALDQIPRAVAHGDFSAGNLRTHGADTVVIDWGTFGMAPVGSDLAHVALSLVDHDQFGHDQFGPVQLESLMSAHLDGLQGRYDRDAVERGCRMTMSLVGVSRLHWMLSSAITPPAGYLEFLRAHQPIEQR